MTHYNLNLKINNCYNLLKETNIEMYKKLNMTSLIIMSYKLILNNLKMEIDKIYDENLIIEKYENSFNFRFQKDILFDKIYNLESSISYLKLFFMTMSRV
jgi:hypothetical protein|uniref:Uncharacterized protein n=1 Tax=viral metagenome TaxID=1070528 RepID=A0A6C0H0P1_9ZZZZ